uniref:Uncharacterized protein n=1 Tax=Caenorhabditis japonica TaxID=281687 RepID=A0A8R1DSY3_CAEJA
MLTFLHLNVYLLFFASAVLGISAALLWAGNGVYLVKVSKKDRLQTNSGIMWAMLQSSLVTGAIFLLYVLHSEELSNSFDFIYIVFASATALGIVILLLLPSTTNSSEEQVGVVSVRDDEQHLLPDPIPNEASPPSSLKQLKQFFTLMFSPRMLCLSCVFVFTGLEMAFYTGVFTSCLSSTLALKNITKYVVPISVLSIGFGQILGGAVTGPLTKKWQIKSSSIIVFALFCHLIAFALIFVSLPYDSTTQSTDAATILNPALPIVLIISCLLGISDAFWQTQIYVIIGSLYKNETANAFAVFKFFQVC